MLWVCKISSSNEYPHDMFAWRNYFLVGKKSDLELCMPLEMGSSGHTLRIQIHLCSCAVTLSLRTKKNNKKKKKRA